MLLNGWPKSWPFACVASSLVPSHLLQPWIVVFPSGSLDVPGS